MDRSWCKGNAPLAYPSLPCPLASPSPLMLGEHLSFNNFPFLISVEGLVVCSGHRHLPTWTWISPPPGRWVTSLLDCLSPEVLCDGKCAGFGAILTGGPVLLSFTDAVTLGSYSAPEPYLPPLVSPLTYQASPRGSPSSGVRETDGSCKFWMTLQASASWARSGHQPLQLTLFIFLSVKDQSDMLRESNV